MIRETVPNALPGIRLPDIGELCARGILGSARNGLRSRPGPDRFVPRVRGLAPLVHRLREANLALSTWIPRPSWISAPLRRAVMDPPRNLEPRAVTPP